MVVPKELTPESLAPFVQLLETIKWNPVSRLEPLAIMQLNHTGRQAPRIIGGRGYFGRPSAPSAVPLRSRNESDGVVSKFLYHWLFPTPEELTDEGVEDVIEGFVRGAKLAMEAGFDGVQIHASHGCECKACRPSGRR